MQIYHSALCFVPRDSLLFKTFSTDEIPRFQLIVKASVKDWEPAYPAYRPKFGFAAFSPDGLHVLSGSGGNIVRVWDVATGVCVHALSHADCVVSALYTPSSTRIITISNPHTHLTIVYVWDPISGKLLYALGDHYGGTTVGNVEISQYPPTLIVHWCGIKPAPFTCWDLTTEPPQLRDSDFQPVFSPASPQFQLVDGWVVSIASGRRLFLVPPAFTGAFATMGTLIALGHSGGGRIAILNFTEV